MSKILEVIVFKRLDQHLESNNILAIEQFGFREGVSIESSVFHPKFLSHKTRDLTKVFDGVNHDILLNKLNYYGITGKYHHWFKLYLTNRKQGVNVSSQIFKVESSSSWETVTNGVPWAQSWNLYYL